MIGYGSQGHAQAQNMRDAGMNVIVGLRKGSKTWEKVEEDGLRVMTVAEAAEQADIIHVLIQMKNRQKYIAMKLHHI